MIILMGVAGAGKSMQGRILADEKGYPWISSGEILRVLVTGKRRQEMLQGKLLSDEEMIKVFDTVLNIIDPKEEFVLDGFPRTIVQADWLVDKAKKGRFRITAVFHLTTLQEVVSRRLQKRGRSDDNEAAIKERFKEYETVTLPILDHFRREGITVFDLNADQTPEVIHEEIFRLLNHN